MLAITTGSDAGGQDLDGPAYLPIGHPSEGCVQPPLQILQTGNEWKSRVGWILELTSGSWELELFPGTEIMSTTPKTGEV